MSKFKATPENLFRTIFFPLRICQNRANPYADKPGSVKKIGSTMVFGSYLKPLLAIALASLILAFPTSANNDLYQLRLYYYPNQIEDAPLAYIPIIIPANMPIHHRAYVIFTILFNDFSTYRMSYTPANVQILGVHVEGGHFALNISADALNYGGSHFEYRFVNRLLANAYALGFAYFTLLIEDELRHLPEGTLLHIIPTSQTENNPYIQPKLSAKTTSE